METFGITLVRLSSEHPCGIGLCCVDLWGLIAVVWWSFFVIKEHNWAFLFAARLHRVLASFPFALQGQALLDVVLQEGPEQLCFLCSPFSVVRIWGLRVSWLLLVIASFPLLTKESRFFFLIKASSYAFLSVVLVCSYSNWNASRCQVLMFPSCPQTLLRVICISALLSCTLLSLRGKVHVVAYADLHMLLVPANYNVDTLLPSGNQIRIFLL